MEGLRKKLWQMNQGEIKELQLLLIQESDKTIDLKAIRKQIDKIWDQSK